MRTGGADGGLGGEFEIWTKGTVTRELHNEDEIKIQREEGSDDPYHGQQQQTTMNE